MPDDTVKTPEENNDGWFFDFLINAGVYGVFFFLLLITGWQFGLQRAGVDYIISDPEMLGTFLAALLLSLLVQFITYGMDGLRALVQARKARKASHAATTKTP